MIRLAPRDEALLEALARKVRLLSVAQIAETWWSTARDPEAAARRRLRALADEGWITRLRATARPTPTLERPVVAWRPGDNPPDFMAASHECVSRWDGHARSVPAVVLGPFGGQQFGVSRTGRLKYEFQATHDLGVAAMYLQFCRSRPADAERWIGEDLLAPWRRGEKLPDAVLASAPDARPELVLEFGGAYDSRRIEMFHEDCAEQQLPYELW